MAEVFNAIRSGFVFSQDFDFDPGAIPDGAMLWLNLRPLATPPRAVAIAAQFLQRISATRFRLALSVPQTLVLRPGMVEGDLIQRLSSIDTPLGVRISIPVCEVI